MLRVDINISLKISKNLPYVSLLDIKLALVIKDSLEAYILWVTQIKTVPPNDFFKQVLLLISFFPLNFQTVMYWFFCKT